MTEAYPAYIQHHVRQESYVVLIGDAVVLSRFWESTISSICVTRGGRQSTTETVSVHVRIGHPETSGSTTVRMEDSQVINMTSPKAGDRGRVQRVRSFPEIHIRRTQTRIPSPVTSAIGSRKRARARAKTHRPGVALRPTQSEPSSISFSLATTQPPNPGVISREPTTYEPMITAGIATRHGQRRGGGGSPPLNLSPGSIFARNHRSDHGHVW